MANANKKMLRQIQALKPEMAGEGDIFAAIPDVALLTNLENQADGSIRSGGIGVLTEEAFHWSKKSGFGVFDHDEIKVRSIVKVEFAQLDCGPNVILVTFDGDTSPWAFGAHSESLELLMKYLKPLVEAANEYVKGDPRFDVGDRVPAEHDSGGDVTNEAWKGSLTEALVSATSATESADQEDLILRSEMLLEAIARDPELRTELGSTPIELCMPILVEDKRPWNEPVLVRKERKGVLVLYEHCLVLAREKGALATRVERLNLDDCALTPTSLRWKAEEFAGMRLAAHAGTPDVAFLAAPASGGNQSILSAELTQKIDELTRQR